MRIVKLSASKNGAHKNQTYNGVVPEGWALLPDNVECENFPFGTPKTENVNGKTVVVEWTKGVVPEPEPDVPTELEKLRADVDFIAIMTGVEL